MSAESLLPCNVSAHDLLPEGGLLTFIVPASGRSTLHRTLISLQQQEDPGWRALVLLDGTHVGLEQRTYRLVSLEQARMRVCWLRKRFGSTVSTGGAEIPHGSAGHVRNVAFAHVRTPWLGFVDDDDTVGPRYVAEVAADADAFDAIFFRMRWSPWESELRPDCLGYQCTRRTNTTVSEVLPEWNASFVEKGHCGISFAMRTKVTRPGPGTGRGLRFSNNMFEDYYMRVALYRSKLRVLQSAHVMYYVKGEPRLEVQAGRRLINPIVCTSCKIGIPEARRSSEFQLARVMVAEDPRHTYEHHQRVLLQSVCQKLRFANTSTCLMLMRTDDGADG